MSAQKAALVLLVVLAVLFGVGIAVGTGRGGAAGKPWWATVVQEWFVRERPLLAREVRGPCVTGGTSIVLGLNQPCTVQIARGEGVHVRHLTLGLVEGAKVEATLTPRSDVAGPVSISLRADVSKPPTLPVLEDGAMLLLVCVAPGPVTPFCRVAIL